ncbi:MAG: TlpA family protein disulfide reductase [Reichenbachiella sp.]
MKHLLSIIFIFSISKINAQTVEIIKYPQLLKMIEVEDDKTKIFNFWATWCGPCVKELPQFEQLNEQYQNKGTEVILVSFDFIEDLDKKVKPFIQKKSLKSKIYLLDETDYNAFIDLVDPSWSGAIPATLMVNANQNKRAFFEKEFKESELEKTYIEFIN